MPAFSVRGIWIASLSHCAIEEAYLVEVPFPKRAFWCGLSTCVNRDTLLYEMVVIDFYFLFIAIRCTCLLILEVYSVLGKGYDGCVVWWECRHYKTHYVARLQKIQLESLWPSG